MSEENETVSKSTNEDSHSMTEEKTNTEQQRADQTTVAASESDEVSASGNAVATGNDPISTPEEVDGGGKGEKEAGHRVRVTVCGVTEAGEEVCVTVSDEGGCEGEGEGEEREKKDVLPNGKHGSATFPRQQRLNYSFSSGGRQSPYESEEEGSSSDMASLSQDTSFSTSRATSVLQLVVEDLKQELLAAHGHSVACKSEVREGEDGRSEVREGEDEDLTKTLLEHVVKLKMELATVKEENDKLRHVRSSMDNEIHELTENLFEEAYKMVDEAKGGKVSAEKRLADAAGKIDAMETEMSTLKRIINTSQSPQTHSSSLKTSKSTTLQPHSPSQQQRPRRTSIRRAVHKIQKRAGLGMTRTSSGSSTKGSVHAPLIPQEHKGGESLVAGEIDQEEYAQFHHWMKSLSPPSPPSPPSPASPTTPTPSSRHSFFCSILEQDIRPCLSFKSTALSQRVLQAVQENSVVMESLNLTPSSRSNGHPGHTRSPSMPPEGTLCALCEAKERDCTHKMRLGEEREWLFISQSCRNRVAAVCDFFMHVSHIQKGIIKADMTKLYWQVTRLRAMMQLARYSLSISSDTGIQNR